MSWNWLWAVLMGSFLGALLTPLLKWFCSWYHKPTLEIYEAETDEEAYVEIELAGEKGKGRFVAIKVKNTPKRNGKRAAQGCYVNLMSLEQQIEFGEWEKVVKIRDPEMLPWANRGLKRCYSAQTIEHDAPLTISLCLTRETEQKKVHFQIRGAEAADGRQRDFEEGRYRATLRVYSRNAKSATACVEVTKGATWHDLTVRLIDCEPPLPVD